MLVLADGGRDGDAQIERHHLETECAHRDPRLVQEVGHQAVHTFRLVERAVDRLGGARGIFLNRAPRELRLADD